MSKIVPYGMDFRVALRGGFLGRIEARNYLDWVKKQKCCCCGSMADDPHHVTGYGMEGFGTKSPDYFAIPLCRKHHNDLHHNAHQWELEYGPQIWFSMTTLLQAILDGWFDPAR